MPGKYEFNEGSVPPGSQTAGSVSSAAWNRSSRSLFHGTVSALGSDKACEVSPIFQIKLISILKNIC